MGTSVDVREPPQLSVEELGQVIGEPARLRILLELLGGVPLPAGALAARVGLAPSTVSGHLARLSGAGLVTVEQRGRRRLATLDRPDVAELVESLSRLSAERPVSSLRAATARTALREARSCYDHLAGRLGVAMADLFIARAWLDDDDGTWTVAPAGVRSCGAALGLPIRLPDGSGRPAVRPCPDWTERRPHIAGRLGAALLTALLDAGWVARRPHDRALTVSPLGREALARFSLPGGSTDADGVP